MPHHIEDGDKVAGRQPGHVAPATVDSQSGSLCAGSRTKKEPRGMVHLMNNLACVQDYSKFGRTNDPAT